MRKGIADLLREKEYYPLDSPLWNFFQFPLVNPKSEQEKIANTKIIESCLSNEKGVYVYLNSENEVLYIGKGNPIKSRLLSHYKKVLKGKIKNRRIAFFQDIQDTVTIYWLEIQEKEERELVEHLLSFLLSPKYKKWRSI